jgi:undecaprenyl-diphosphatase
MQAFDLLIPNWMNQFSNLDLTFDKTVYVIADNHLLKGGVIMGLLWWVWMRDGASFIKPGLHAVRTIGGTVLAILVARAMQNLLPGRLRPMQEPTLDFLMPYGDHPPGIVELSSFPSDHAVMFFALATALFFAGRVIGVAAYIWTIVVICLPRIYLGYHYPSDIIAGALVGVLIMIPVMRIPLPSMIPNMLGRFQVKHPGLVFAGIFLLTLQMSTMFENSRRLLAGVAQVFLNIDEQGPDVSVADKCPGQALSAERSCLD